MPCQYCQRCEKLIDLDYDVEHFDMHDQEDEERSSEELLATLNKARAEMKEMGL